MPFIITCPEVVTGWTEWMNSNSPRENPTGDMENYQSLRKQYQFCEDEALADIECRVAGTNISFKESGNLGVTCNINVGLQCLHAMQKLGVCKDFEVRFYCLCPSTSTTTTTTTTRTTAISERTSIPTVTTETKEYETICNGWTDWYNNDSPDDDGTDSELLSKIPNFKNICLKPISYECRSATFLQSYKFTGQKFKEPCNKNGIVCESDGQQCDDYEIRVYCTCPTTSPPPCVSGWTDWFNIDVPYTGEGDTELVEDIRLKHEFCSAEYIEDIECEARSLTVGNLKVPSKGKGGGKIYGKTSGKTSSKTSSKTSGKGGSGSDLPAFSRLTHPGWIDFTDTGDIGVKCTINKGLVCVNALQRKNKRCRDYRVRFHCNCGTGTTPTTVITTPTTAITQTSSEITTPARQLCGWSTWMNVDNALSGDGDYETIDKLQENYAICKPDYITEIECRVANSNTTWSESGQSGLICDRKLGFRCENRLQVTICLDYEVRILCNPPSCPIISTTVTTTETTTPEMTTTSLCLPGQSWSDCAYDCRQMCQSFLRVNELNNYCNENVTCVPGCVSEECIEPHVWRDENTCLKPEECTCYTEEGELVAQIGRAHV